MEKNGTWDKILKEIEIIADRTGKIGWKNISIDGSFAPGKGGGEEVEYGYKGKGSTIHLAIEEHGMPLVATVTSASGNERIEVFKILNSPAIPKDGRIKNLHADKGYDAHSLREGVHIIGINPVIPYRNYKNRVNKNSTQMKSKFRWKVERCFAWFQKKFSRITTRWERKIHIWKAFITIAIMFMWVEKLVLG